MHFATDYGTLRWAVGNRVLSVQTSMTCDFMIRFLRGTRVQFNWHRFCAEEEWSVSVETLTPDRLGHVFTPWYDKDGKLEAAYNEDGARPLTVTEAANRRLEFAPHRVSGIQAKIDEIARGTIDLHVPAFALPDNNFLLLDGNHRMVALAASGVSMSPTLHTVRGLVDVGMLADLAHWTNAR